MTKEEQKQESVSGAARTSAIALLRSPRFFCKLLKALSREGLVGEERNALVVYVVAVSRMLATFRRKNKTL
jgi:hypothetical protein